MSILEERADGEFGPAARLHSIRLSHSCHTQNGSHVIERERKGEGERIVTTKRVRNRWERDTPCEQPLSRNEPGGGRGLSLSAKWEGPGSSLRQFLGLKLETFYALEADSDA